METKNSSNDFISKYFSNIGLETSPNNEEFWTTLEAKYGQQAISTIGKILDERSEGKLNNKLYAVKNESLELSIDFSAYSTDLYRSYFTWLVENKNLQPKNILDLACDNGIVTCFYALLYPQAKVVGVDKSKNSIKCAIELANKLGLNNIEFHVMDMKKSDKFFGEMRFDMITSIRSIKEVLSIRDDERAWSLDEVSKHTIDKNAVKAIQAINKVMTEEGIFITFERLTCAEDAIRFIKLFNLGELSLDKANCARIKFHEIGENQEMPLLSFYKSNDSNENNIINEVIEFYNSAPTVNGEWDPNSHIESEIKLKNIKNKKLVRGIQTNYSDNSGKMREELWVTDENALYYKYTNIGYRKLVIKRLGEEKELKGLLEQTEKFMPMMGNKIHIYNSVEERDEIK